MIKHCHPQCARDTKLTRDLWLSLLYLLPSSAWWGLDLWGPKKVSPGKCFLGIWTAIGSGGSEMYRTVPVQSWDIKVTGDLPPYVPLHDCQVLPPPPVTLTFGKHFNRIGTVYLEVYPFTNKLLECSWKVHAGWPAINCSSQNTNWPKLITNFSM